MKPETIPLDFSPDDNDPEADAKRAKMREARERETILVHTIVTGIAAPLARAFRAMPETGLLTTRYSLYTNACKEILYRGHVIPFMHHDISIPDLLDHVWRTSKETAQ